MSGGKKKDTKRGNFEFALPDAMLMLLNADHARQITGMTRLTAYSYLLEAEIGMVARGTVNINGGRLGIISPEVNKSLDTLISSGRISKTGYRRGSYYGITISRNGANYISKKFNGLPADVTKWLSVKRRIIDAMTSDDVVKYLCVHHSDCLPKAVIDKYDERTNSGSS